MRHVHMVIIDGLLGSTSNPGSPDTDLPINHAAVQAFRTVPCSFQRGREHENAERRARQDQHSIEYIPFCSSDFEETDLNKDAPCTGLMVLIMVSFESWYTSFGLVLDHWGMLELFVTGRIVFPCLTLGCIKTGVDSDQALTVKEWVKGWYDLKDTAVGNLVTEKIGAAL